MLRLVWLTSVLSFSPREKAILDGPGMNQAKAASMRFELEAARENMNLSQVSRQWSLANEPPTRRD
jgi:hypothetical protein